VDNHILFLLWGQHNLVGFSTDLIERFIKAIGNIMAILIILTEQDS